MRKMLVLMGAAVAIGACSSGSSSSHNAGSTAPHTYCQRVAEFQQERVRGIGAGAADLSAQRFSAAADKFVAVNAAAPAAIKADTAYVLQGFRAEVAAVAGAGNDTTKVIAALTRMNASIDKQRAHAADEHIALVTKQQCNVVFDIGASQKDVQSQLDDPTGCYSEDAKICK